MNRPTFPVLSFSIIVLFAIGCSEGFKPDPDHFSFENIHHFYSQQSEITDPGDYVFLYRNLPENPVTLAGIVQGVCMHEAYYSSRGIKIPGKQKGYENSKVENLLKKIYRLNQNSLVEERSLDDRIVVICSNYATLYCSMLRYVGIPARVRSGYSTYFFPGKYDNHYICEYWNVEKAEWIKVDPQLDDRHKEYFKIDFNPFDIPPGKFITGGNAWLMCRDNDYDPLLFGLGGGDNWDGGIHFVRPGVFSDFITLNKFEVQPWDINPEWDNPAKLELKFIDSIAITTQSDDFLNNRIALYNSFDVLRLPRNWKAK